MKSIRLIALLLALCVLVAAFAGCQNKTPDEDESTKAGGNETETVADEVYPEISKKNWGEEFYLSIVPDVNPVDYYWVAEAGNNTLSDAIYNRQEEVRKYLGVEVFGTGTENTDKYVAPFKTAIKNKDNSVHMLVSHVFFGIDGFITENYLTDLNDMESLDLEADYWNQQFMEDLSVKDHIYLGFNDFNILYTNVVLFNKDMLERYSDSIDGTLYDKVQSYTWTLDEMISLSSMVYLDTTSDGKTEDDTYGMTAFLNVPFAPLLQASNISVVEMDEKGNYAVSVYNEKNKQKMSDLVDKLYDWVRADDAWLKMDSGSPSAIFTSGRSLMHLATTYSLPNLLSYEIDFGVLPYPMYDVNQKDVGYRSLQWGGYICIPSYLANGNMVGETVEMLAFFSDDVNIAFYEKLLGKQVADAPLDRIMLDMVWDSVCSDFGQTYGSAMNTGTTDFLFILCNLVKEGTTYNLASYVASGESTANKGLKNFIKQVDD